MTINVDLVGVGESRSNFVCLAQQGPAFQLIDSGGVGGVGRYQTSTICGKVSIGNHRVAGPIGGDSHACAYLRCCGAAVSLRMLPPTDLYCIYEATVLADCRFIHSRTIPIAQWLECHVQPIIKFVNDQMN